MLHATLPQLQDPPQIDLRRSRFESERAVFTDPE